MKDKHKRLERYGERCFWAGMRNRTYNNVCLRCRKTFKTNDKTPKPICSCCGKDDKIVYLGFIARAPKKNASDREWKKFEKYMHLK